MIDKINACRTPEELHHIGFEISSSKASDDIKKPLWDAIKAKMKTLNDIMAEQSEFTSSDVGFEDYRFEE